MHKTLPLLAMLLMLCGCSPTPWARHLGPWLHPGVFFVDTDRCAIAMTIDDAPSLDGVSTQRMLDSFERHEARATFFVTGNRINARSTPVLQRALAAGFELGNHGFQETPSACRLPQQDFVQNLRHTETLLLPLLASDDVAAARLRWYRAGGGYVSREMRRHLAARSHSYQIALADVLPLDTNTCDVEVITRRILDNVRPGSIVVLHDSDRDAVLFADATPKCGATRGERTVQVLDRVLPQLRAAGWRVTTLSALADQTEAVAEAAVAPCPLPAGNS